LKDKILDYRNTPRLIAEKRKKRNTKTKKPFVKYQCLAG